MIHAMILAVALLVPTAAPTPETDAKTLAQDILTNGAVMFDTKDATAMADTYTDDGELTVFSKDETTGRYKAQDTRGKSAVEQFYQDIFKDRKAGARSKNVVELAHFVGDDLLIIHGNFTPAVGDSAPVPFVQVRAKEGEKWLIKSLQLFVVSEKK